METPPAQSRRFSNLVLILRLFSPNNADWNCIDQEEAAIPLWQGGKFNFVKGVEDGYIVLKARLGQLMDIDRKYSGNFASTH